MTVHPETIYRVRYETKVNVENLSQLAQEGFKAVSDKRLQNNEPSGTESHSGTPDDIYDGTIPRTARDFTHGCGVMGRCSLRLEVKTKNDNGQKDQIRAICDSDDLRYTSRALAEKQNQTCRAAHARIRKNFIDYLIQNAQINRDSAS